MSTTIKNGSSEFDSVILKFADNDVEIKNWLTYSFNQNFLEPTCEWSFDIEDTNGNLIDILVCGVKIKLFINDLIQCTGLIEKVLNSETTEGGSLIKIQGRDIMAKVVEGIVNPKLQFPTNTTLESIVKTVLKPLEITTIDNSNNLNLNVLTGKSFPPDEDQGFNKKALKELKAHYGEGSFQFLDKLLKRQGFMMWARADGEGVVISQPNYTNDPLYNLQHFKGNNSVNNNVLSGERIIDITGQPIMLYCKGHSNGDDADVVSSDIIMINELIGLDQNGIPLPQVTALIAQFQTQGVRVLDMRNALISDRQEARLFYQRPIVVGPCFIKDDEAQDGSQLENFVKRSMSHFQVKMIVLHYRVLGHTQNGVPWTINTMVDVRDDYLDIQESYWIIERSFHKSSGGGTYTELKLIKPYTLDISTFGGGKTIKVK